MAHAAVARHRRRPLLAARRLPIDPVLAGRVAVSGLDVDQPAAAKGDEATEPLKRLRSNARGRHSPRGHRGLSACRSRPCHGRPAPPLLRTAGNRDVSLVAEGGLQGDEEADRGDERDRVGVGVAHL